MQFCAHWSQPITQLAKIAHLHALVIGYEHERRALQLVGKIGNDAGFFWSHLVSIIESLRLHIQIRGWINADSGGHGRTDCHAFKVPPFGAGGTSSNHCLDDCVSIFH